MTGINAKDCTNLGEQYRVILDKCYFFEKNKKTVDEAEENCHDVFGPNRHGKVIEPQTVESLEMVQEVSREIFGEGKDVLTGFKKMDDKGLNVVYHSTGLKTVIEPWIGNGRIDDENQDYVRFLTQETDVWQDGKNDEGWLYNSVCEIPLKPTQQNWRTVAKGLFDFESVY